MRAQVETELSVFQNVLGEVPAEAESHPPEFILDRPAPAELAPTGRLDQPTHIIMMSNKLWLLSTTEIRGWR